MTNDPLKDLEAENLSSLKDLIVQAHEELLAMLRMAGETASTIANHPAVCALFVEENKPEKQAILIQKEREEGSLYSPIHGADLNARLTILRGIMLSILMMSDETTYLDYETRSASHGVMHMLGFADEESCEEHRADAKRVAAYFGADNMGALQEELAIAVVFNGENLIPTIFKLAGVIDEDS